MPKHISGGLSIEALMHIVSMGCGVAGALRSVVEVIIELQQYVSIGSCVIRNDHNAAINISERWDSVGLAEQLQGPEINILLRHARNPQRQDAANAS